jgi:hypothetical protein
MAVDPIEARCDRCGDDFHLFELLDDRSGTCPRCRRTLTLDWTAKLLEDAERADIAQRQLIGALRSLRNLPGNLSVRPHVILRNLFEEVGWQKDLAGDPEMLREELRELRRLLIAWELLDPVVAAAQPHRGWFSRAVDVLTGRPPEPVVSVPGGHDALDELDQTAEAPTDPGDRQAEKVPVAS